MRLYHNRVGLCPRNELPLNASYCRKPQHESEVCIHLSDGIQQVSGGNRLRGLSLQMFFNALLSAVVNPHHFSLLVMDLNSLGVLCRFMSDAERLALLSPLAVLCEVDRQ